MEDLPELSAAIRGLLYEVEACPLLDILPGEVLTMVFNQLYAGELSGLVLVCKSLAAPVCDALRISAVARGCPREFMPATEVSGGEMSRGIFGKAFSEASFSVSVLASLCAAPGRMRVSGGSSGVSTATFAVLKTNCNLSGFGMDGSTHAPKSGSRKGSTDQTRSACIATGIGLRSSKIERGLRTGSSH